MATQTGKRAIGFLAAGALLLSLLIAVSYWQARGADMSNPHANLWRAVRQGVHGFTTVSSEGHKVLIQNGGENWREIRNGLLMRFSQWVLAVALLGLGLLYLFVGKDKLEKERSGVKIQRYTLGERVLHWCTALLFITMAITGLSLLLGRLAMIPIFGHPAVSGYLHVAKALHNYCGPFLLVGILLEFLIWARFNIPKKTDLQWFKNLGGMIGSGPRPHTGKINGGEKAWFWVVFLCGIAVGVTGITLDFPIWGQTRFIMQLSYVIHVTFAVLFVAASFGHIYLGTIGAEGTFEAMWTGSVDTAWARQHNDLWYEEKMREV
ncbi:MAG: formate dehydrogenase subunit gamma [Syntrophobacteraceae bacterium]|jgi:formate dehydrogenase subunit gamma